MVPRSFSKLAFVPKSFYEFDQWFLSVRHQYGNDIVTMVHCGNSENVSINSSRSNNLSLLAEVDCRQDGREIRRPARFYLDKTQHITVERYQVDLAGYLHAAAVAADGSPKIRQNGPISLLFQIFRR